MFSVSLQAKPSQAECGIFLCLPVGFSMKGCSDSFKAFKKRIRKFQSPLPNYFSCTGSSDQSSPVTNKSGLSAFVPKGEVCAVKEIYKNSNGRSVTKCLKSLNFATENYFDDQVCKRTVTGSTDDKIISTSPLGCTKTVKYTATYQNGSLIGKPYHYNF